MLNLSLLRSLAEKIELLGAFYVHATCVGPTHNSAHSIS